MRKTIHILICTLFALGCQRIVPMATVDEDARVTLHAETDGAVETRTAYMGTTNPTLTAAVWASTTSGTYAAGSADGTSASSYAVSRHMTANFSEGGASLPDNENSGIVYPYNPEGEPQKPYVYFVGLYPSTSWTQAASTSAQYTFHGYEDLMYAPQTYGYYAIRSGDVGYPTTLHFYHVLTYLRFQFIMEGATEALREEVSHAWGKLTNIKLTGQGASTPFNSISIALGEAANLSAVESASSFSKAYGGGTEQLPLYATSTDNEFPGVSGYALPTSADPTESAYVICAPVAASNSVGVHEYTLTLETQHRNGEYGKATVNIDLKGSDDTLYSGSTMGQMFVVTLRFTLNSIVAAAAVVNDWSNGGYGKYTFDE